MKHQLQINPNSIDIFKNISFYPLPVIDEFNYTVSVYSAKTTWKAISALWFKGTYSTYIVNIMRRKYNNIILHPTAILPNNPVLKTLLDKSQEEYSLANIPTSVRAYNFTNTTLVDFLCI